MFKRFCMWMAASVAILILSGCAANVRVCGSHHGVFGCVGGSTGGQQQMGGYQQGGHPVLIQQQQPIYVVPQPQYHIPPPVLFQPHIPPPTLFRPHPMPRTGPCVGYRLVPGAGYVCQGYQWGGYTAPLPRLDRQQSEQDFLAFRDQNPA